MATNNFKRSQGGFPTFAYILDIDYYIDEEMENLKVDLGDDLHNYTEEELEEMVEERLYILMGDLELEDADRISSIIERYTYRISETLANKVVDKAVAFNLLSDVEGISELNDLKDSLGYYLDGLIKFDIVSGYYVGFSVVFYLDEDDFLYEIKSTLDVTLSKDHIIDMLNLMYTEVNEQLEEFYDNVVEEGIPLRIIEHVSVDSSGNAYYTFNR